MKQILIAILISGLVLFVAIFVSGSNKNSENNSINMTQQNNDLVAKENNLQIDESLKVYSSDQNPIAVLDTDFGKIKIELLPKEAPKTVENFINLSKQGFYDGTKFHRVIKDFMIQGGDPNSKDDNKINLWGTGGPGYSFEDEINDVPMLRGVLAMANSGPNTNGSQFFIITANETSWLSGLHTAFGYVVEGLDVVFEIQEVQTIKPADRPVQNIVLEKVTIE